MDSGRRRVLQLERARRMDGYAVAKERVYHARECRVMVLRSLVRSRRVVVGWWWCGALVVTLDLLRQA